MLPTFNNFDISIIGKAHYTQKLNCQDHVFFKNEKDRIIGIVADGIGSLPFSEFSSFLYSTSILTLLCNLNLNIINDNNLSDILDLHILHVNKLLVSIIGDNFLDKSLGSTIILYIITNESTSIYSKGDGFYGVDTLNNGKAFSELNGNDKRIYNCTFVQNFKTETKNIKSVWVSTDGLRYSNLLKDSLKNINEYFCKLFDIIKIESYSEKLLDDLAICVSVKD